MTALPHEPITQADFPAWEQRQLAKHEFVGGHIYAFAGGTRAHNAMVSQLIAVILTAARPCRTYGSDMLVEMAASTRYPDVVVTCDERDSSDMRALVVRYPKLIVEVLPESTAQDDLGSKMREYQAIETLEEYVTIDSRKRWAQVSRKSGQEWVLNVPVTGGSLELRSIGLTIDLDEIFAQGSLD